jgi:hypothetical protein
MVGASPTTLPGVSGSMEGRMKNTLHMIPAYGYVLLTGRVSILDYEGNTGYFPFVSTLPAVSRNEAYRRGLALQALLRRQWDEQYRELEALEAAAEAAADPYNWAIVP